VRSIDHDVPSLSLSCWAGGSLLALCSDYDVTKPLYLSGKEGATRALSSLSGMADFPHWLQPLQNPLTIPTPLCPQPGSANIGIPNGLEVVSVRANEYPTFIFSLVQTTRPLELNL
jgi:hypothetical protein